MKIRFYACKIVFVFLLLYVSIMYRLADDAHLLGTRYTNIQHRTVLLFLWTSLEILSRWDLRN